MQRYPSSSTRAGLLAAALASGCFDPHLDRDSLSDARIPNVPPLPQIRLTSQIAQVQVSGADLGNPDPKILFLPIAPAPQVRIATRTGAFGEDPASYADDGSISFPVSYAGTTWRLEYTLADGIPHEVQWAPEPSRGHLTVPIFGRTDRDPVPAGSGYQITTTFTADYNFPRVLTTGLWTEGMVTAQPGQRTFDYDFVNAVSLSGAKGRLAESRGDRALLVDYELNLDTFCRSATGAAAFTADLQADVHATVSSTWETSTKPLTIRNFDLDYVDRLSSNLGALRGGAGAVTGDVVVGPTASLAMPGLVRTSSAWLLPSPVMHALVQCSYLVDPLPTKLLLPADFQHVPIVLHIQLVQTRSIEGLGISLSSGMATLLTTPADATALDFNVAFPAAMPMHITLTPPGLNAVDLSDGDADHLSIGPATGTFTLGFIPEAGPDIRSDYYDVILHKITGGALTSKRIYTVITPSVQIDGAALEAGSEYVFEIRAYKGHPLAARGDFSVVEFPYGAAVVFTRTFKTS